LDSIPPPLEDAPFESPKSILQGQTTAHMQGITTMRIMPIKFQKYQVRIKLEINGEIFKLNALLDTGSYMKLVHKELIPAKYWLPSN